ncbi:MAG: class I SAM-dependent methyltransferase [Planctomycetota bacterium]
MRSARGRGKDELKRSSSDRLCVPRGLCGSLARDGPDGAFARQVARRGRRRALRRRALELRREEGPRPRAHRRAARQPPACRRGRVVGLDASPAMLAQARATAHPDTELLLGDLARLPFADRSFDAVVCCRLLHHLERAEDLARVVAELVRVSRDLVLVTYWDAAALPAWRRRLLPARRAPRRFARARVELETLFERAGAPVVARAWSLRFVSRQAYLVARRRP